jgi:hypothetical protein
MTPSGSGADTTAPAATMQRGPMSAMITAHSPTHVCGPIVTFFMRVWSVADHWPDGRKWC